MSNQEISKAFSDQQDKDEHFNRKIWAECGKAIGERIASGQDTTINHGHQTALYDMFCSLNGHRLKGW